MDFSGFGVLINTQNKKSIKAGQQGIVNLLIQVKHASVANHWNVVIQINEVGAQDIHRIVVLMMIVVVVLMMIVVDGRSVYTCDSVFVSVEK
jgi:hypothetical protein